MTPRHRRIALLTGASRAAITVPCHAPLPFLAAVAGRLEKRGLLKPDRPIEPTFEECDCTLTIAKLRAAKRAIEEAEQRDLTAVRKCLDDPIGIPRGARLVVTHGRYVVTSPDAPPRILPT